MRSTLIEQLAALGERIMEAGVEFGRAKQGRRISAEVVRLEELFGRALREFHEVLERLPKAFVTPRPYAEAASVFRAAIGVLVVVERYGNRRQRRAARLAHARAHAEFAVTLTLGSDVGESFAAPLEEREPPPAIPAGTETKARRLDKIRKAGATRKRLERAKGGEAS